MYARQDADDLIREQVEKARGKVSVVVSEHSPHARAIFAHATGQHLLPPATPPQEGELGPTVILPCKDAAELLRQHASKGGQVIADTIENPVFKPDYWLLFLLPEKLVLKGLGRGAVLWETVTEYDNVSNHVVTPQQLGQDEGPSHVPMRMDDGTKVRVYGATGEAAIMAANLVAIVNSGRIPVPEHNTEIRVRDEKLASLLHDVYASMPAAVKEAITALRKLPGKKDRWLTRVLWGRPELRKLAKAVRHELTGK
ncbi:MAG: hypothetical protein JNM56_25110 [Planctomycetia bacterium]|nr:hypothetical protein [Planctomycetia bacterium]